MPFDLDDDEYRATRILTGADKVDDINVGEYIRTNKGEIGYIFQINNENKYSKYRVKIDTNSICKSVYLKKEEIVKHSKNIIDLIETGDYVNEMYIQEIILLKNDIMECMVDSDYECITTIKNVDVKSILTKEKFESMEYKIGG